VAAVSPGGGSGERYRKAGGDIGVMAKSYHGERGGLWLRGKPANRKGRKKKGGKGKIDSHQGAGVFGHGRPEGGDSGRTAKDTPKT